MALTKQNFLEKAPEPMKIESIFEFSFDDSYKEDMRCADILEKYGLRGTFYIIVDAIGKEGRLTWDDVKALDKRGHTIGSHTITHPSDLKVLYDQDLHYEIQNSKDMIEMVLGHNISKFCYPRGRVDDRVKNFVHEAGYVEGRITGKPGVITVEDKLRMPGTVHLFQRQEYEGIPILDYAKKVIDTVKNEGGYCNIWGHGNEITKYDLWNVLEEICKYVVR